MYEVAATCASADVAERFVRWLLEEHLAEVRACAGVRRAELVRVDGLHVRATYRFTGRAAFARYLERDAPRLRTRGRELFSEAEVTFSRSDGIVLHTIP
jgi:hypothetical protein